MIIAMSKPLYALSNIVIIARAARNFFSLNATNWMKSIRFNGDINMKAFKSLRAVILLIGILLSACTTAPKSQSTINASSAGSDKPLSEVVFTGSIESMNSDQWVINGQTITVDSSTLQDGSFRVGDTVKVEARVASNGTVTAKNIESSSMTDLAETATSAPDPTVTGTPVVFDDTAKNEAVGTVEAVTDTSITIGGQTYTFAPGAEIKGTIAVGSIVKLHFVATADGTLSVREIEIANPNDVSENNGNDDNSADDSSNGTNVNENSSNDNSDNNSNVNSNDDNGNDDHGNGNSNDDSGDDDNGNDSSNGNN